MKLTSRPASAVSITLVDDQLRLSSVAALFPTKGDGHKGRSFSEVKTQVIGKTRENPTEPISARFARTETERRSEPGIGPARGLRGSHGSSKAL
jgi:hypothetical protein